MLFFIIIICRTALKTYSLHCFGVAYKRTLVARERSGNVLRTYFRFWFGSEPSANLRPYVKSAKWFGEKVIVVFRLHVDYSLLKPQ